MDPDHDDFLSREDDEFLGQPRPERESGPPWWEGHWPQAGLNDLAGLGEWVEGRLNELIFWTQSSMEELREIGLLLGLQALRNAERFLGRTGDGNHPRHGPLVDALEVERALEDLLRFLRGSDAATPKKQHAIAADEANELARKYLADHPDASARQVAEAVGIALGRISRLPAWRAVYGRRQAQKPVPKKKADRELTPKMLESIGRKDDGPGRVDAEDAVWQKLLEKASPDERARLHAKSKDERRRLIQLAASQYADELDDTERS